MQRLTVDTISTKSGTGKGNKTWTLIIVKGVDGIEATSFDTKLQSLGKGDVIDFEPELTSVDGKAKVNIKSWNTVSKAAVPPATVSPGVGAEPAPAPANTGLTVADIEARTRFTALIQATELAVRDKIKAGEILPWAGSFYRWLKNPSTTTAAATAPQPGKKAPEDMTTAELEAELFKKDTPRDPQTIKTRGDLFQACYDDFKKMPSNEVAKALGYAKPEDVSGRFPDLYLTIKSLKEGQNA